MIPIGNMAQFPSLAFSRATASTMSAAMLPRSMQIRRRQTGPVVSDAIESDRLFEIRWDLRRNGQNIKPDSPRLIRPFEMGLPLINTYVN
jgi:hypothetical protein